MKETQQTLFGKFIHYVSLNALGMLGLSCYILADTFFVARGLGSNGLAALNLAIPVYSFVHGCGLMIGMGGATKYSVFKGQGDHKSAQKVFSQTISMVILFSICFVLVGLMLSGQIAVRLGADAQVYDMTKTYLQVVLLFAPAFLANDVLLSFVRNDQDPKLSMQAMLIGSMSNIVLDYIFIFPLHMGIFGAVLATGIAPLISIGILCSRHHFDIHRTKGSLRLAVGICSLGMPSLITEVASGIVMIVFNALILKLQGNIGVAAYGVIANLALVVTAVFNGIAQGVQPITSFAYGQQDWISVRKMFKYAFFTVMLLSAFVYLSFSLAADPITAVFNSEGSQQLQEIAVTGIRLYFMAVPLIGFNLILSMHFISIEKAFPAQVISLLRGFFVLLPVTFMLTALLQMTGVWLAVPITEGIVALIGVLLLKFHKR